MQTKTSLSLPSLSPLVLRPSCCSSRCSVRTRALSLSPSLPPSPLPPRERRMSSSQNVVRKRPTGRGSGSSISGSSGASFFVESRGGGKGEEESERKEDEYGREGGL